MTDVVGPDQIGAVVARWTGIPVSKLSQSDRDRLLNLSDRLKERVVGQAEAVEAVRTAAVGTIFASEAAFLDLTSALVHAIATRWRTPSFALARG
eukprot:SAG31_NODE_4147_length_3531_cov_1.458333_2_plen_95_part_00